MNAIEWPCPGPAQAGNATPFLAATSPCPFSSSWPSTKERAFSRSNRFPLPRRTVRTGRSRYPTISLLTPPGTLSRKLPRAFLGTFAWSGAGGKGRRRIFFPAQSPRVGLRPDCSAGPEWSRNHSRRRTEPVLPWCGSLGDGILRVARDGPEAFTAGGRFRIRPPAVLNQAASGSGPVAPAGL